MKTPFLIFLMLMMTFAFQANAKVKPKTHKVVRAMKYHGVVKVAVYAKMKPAQRRDYINKVRKAWLAFELGMRKSGKYQFADNAIQSEHYVLEKFWSLFFPEACAEGEDPYCVVGGVRRKLTADNKCPTGGRQCGEAGTDKFKCGALYVDSTTHEQACIDRLPRETLSERCAAAGTDYPSIEAYKKFKTDFELIRASCDPTSPNERVDDRYKANCDMFIEKLDKTLEELKSKNLIDEAGNVIEAGPEAPPEETPTEVTTPPAAPSPESPPPELEPGTTTPETNVDTTGDEPLPNTDLAPSSTNLPAAEVPGPMDADIDEDGNMDNTEPVFGADGKPITENKSAGIKPGPGSPAPYTGPCKVMHALVVEGSTANGSTNFLEQGLHENAARWANMYKGWGASTYMMTPAPNADQVLMSNPQAVQNLKDTLSHLDVPKSVCSNKTATGAMVQLLMGSDPKLVKADMRNNPKTDGIVKIPQSQSKGSPFDDIEPVKKAEEIKKSCGDKADQVMVINIVGHGSSEPCEIQIGARKLTPDHLANLQKKMIVLGVKTIFNIDAAGSECFKDKINPKYISDKPCVLTSNRANELAYGADTLMSNTYSELVPAFLKTGKNPRVAHLCATLWDPFNAQSASDQWKNLVSGGVKTPDQWKSDLKAASEKLGVTDLTGYCPKPAGAPIKTPEGLTDQQMKEVINCPDVVNGLKSALNAIGANGQAVLSSVYPATATNNVPPGIVKIQRMADEEKDSLKESCNIDLSKYATSPPVQNLQMPAPAADEGTSDAVKEQPQQKATDAPAMPVLNIE